MIIPYQDALVRYEWMLFEQCDSESYSHPMHRLSASETRSGDFNRLKIEAVLPSSIRESKTAAHPKKAGTHAQIIFFDLRT